MRWPVLAVMAIGIVVIIAMIFMIPAMYKKNTDACSKIGAEYRWGRDFGVCVKPDGSIWSVP